MRRPPTYRTERRERRSLDLPAPTDYVAALDRRQRALVVESLLRCPRPEARTDDPQS